MDILKKVVDDLTPLGGEMALDAFIDARRAAAPAPPPRPAAKPAARVTPPPAAPKPARAPAETIRLATLTPEVDPSDTGKLRLEVEAFMNRDAAEETDDDEVQEFLKDRSGFDPSELG